MEIEAPVAKGIEGLETVITEEKAPFIRLPSGEELLLMERVSAELKKKAKSLVVVGMGGSSRGAKAVCEAVRRDGGRVKFLDNLDEALIEEVLEGLDWSSTAFAFISKSGKTLETITIMNVILEELVRRGENPKERCVFIGDRGKAFEELSREMGVFFLEIPESIGGRFSVFTASGLFPLIFGGYEIREFLRGAKRAIEKAEQVKNFTLYKFENYKRGRDISVIMPYSSFMNEFSEWYVQLWGESLGKDGKGQTPLKAVGTSSQHAILQLFLEGKDDKFYQIIEIEEKGRIKLREAKILDYLKNKSVQEIVKAELIGTLKALREKGRPVSVIKLKALNEGEMGELMMFYMLSTVMMAELMGVNPYGQPAVEIGKRYAREILKRGG